MVGALNVIYPRTAVSYSMHITVICSAQLILVFRNNSIDQHGRTDVVGASRVPLCSA
jgi:hypothetical protein